MVVYGHKISDSVIEACFRQLPGRLTSWQISLTLVKLGVPRERYRPEEAANRLLQRWRKEGRVAYSAKLGWRKSDHD